QQLGCSLQSRELTTHWQPFSASKKGYRGGNKLVSCGRGLGRLARHRIRPRWHDDRGVGMAGGDLAVDAVLVVCAVAGERSDGIVNLVEQGTDLRAVIEIIGCQRRRDDAAGVGIDTDVQFAPR